MNQAQINSLVRSILKLAAGLFAARGLQDTATWLNGPDALAAGLLIVSLLWSHVIHSSTSAPTDDSPTSSRGGTLPLFLLAGILCLTGCGALKQKQVLDKSTVFGLQAVTPGTSGSGQIKLQIGLVRNEYYSNPTSTNPIYAAPFSSHVNAKLSLINQSADEDFSTLPQAVVTDTNGNASAITGK